MAEKEGGAADGPDLSPDREGRSPSPGSEGPAAGQSEVMLRGGRPWGFTLQGGAEVVSPLTIAKIEAGGKADVDGRLQIGDEVLCINDVTATSHDEAVQLVCSAFRTLTLLVRRGAFDQTPSPRSVSLLRRAYEPNDPDTRAQDDSVVYSESKSARHGARLRPQRRGESFSIRSTSKRPTSWHPVDTSSLKTDPVGGLRSPQSPLGATKSPNAETSKSKRSPKSPGALASSSSMQFGAPDSLSMASYSSFQSLQNLGAAKSTSSMGPVGAPPGAHMSNSVPWHGGHVSSAQSQPALNKPPMQPPPVEPRRKGHSSGGGVSSGGYPAPVMAPIGVGREHYGARPRVGTYTEGEDHNNGGFMSYSQSQVQLNHHQSSANHSLPNPPVPTAHSMQDIRQRQGSKDYAHSGWSRPTPYKPNNYENIDAFEAAKSNAAASLSHSSLIQAQAYSHSYTNFAQSRSISDDGFNHGEEAPEQPRSDPPEIPPWPQPDHRKMLSEDSGVELSMTSPPLPPGRDDSRGHYMLKPSRSQERLTSWPSYPQQGEEEQDKGRTGPRAHSWASYQPRLNAHLEEKQDNRHTNTNYPQHAVIGNGDSSGAVHSAYGVDTKAEVELRNLYNARPSYPGYGYETNYDVFHASQEPIQKETSAVDDLFSYANQSRDLSGKSTPTGHTMNSSPPPPLPQTAPPLPQTAPPLPQTTPPLPQTAPPLPQTAPPPMPQKTRAGSSSGHTIIVRQKPFYNTATQTEVSPPPPAAPSSQYLQGAPPPAPRAAQPQQPVPAEPMFRNVEIQVNMDLVMVTPMVTPMSTLDRRKHKKADQGCQVQPSMLPETLSSSLMNTGLVVQQPLSPGLMAQQPLDNYADVNSFHRTAPIVDKMTQEKRIPETIREESPKKYENASTAQEMCNPTQEVKDTILQSIHDHSPSQTSLMRKLSREFFGNQMKQPNYSSHPSLLTVPETQPQRRRSGEPPARPGEPPLLRQSKEYWSPPDAEVAKAVTNKPPPCAADPAKDGEPQKEGKKKFDRSKKLSLRKAFGIFDEIESVDDINSRRHLSSHGKSMSASQVGNVRNHHLYAEIKEIKEGAPTEEKPLRWYNRPKGDEVHHKDALHQRYDSGHFSQEENSNASKIAQKLPFNDNHVKKLHRTSSEQIRPVKERIAERERSMEQAKSPEMDIIRDKRHKLSDPTQRHKNSDPLEFQGKPGNPGHRSSDPSMEEYRKATTTQHRLSDPASSQREKRLSGDSDLFRGSSYEPSSLQRRSGSIRSTSSSSLDGHRMSDPELKKMQHLAVLNFFEMKTGKRLSSSSMDSSGNSKYNSLSSRGSSSIDSAVGLYRDRSPSPQKSPDEQTPFSQDHAFHLKKSKSLPRDMAGNTEEGGSGLGLSLPPEPAPSIDSRPGSASSRDLTTISTQKERRRSGSRWEYHKKEKSAPSQMESYQIVPVENGSTHSASTGPANSTDQAHHAAPVPQPSPATDSQLSPGAGTSPERVDTSEPLDSSLPLPKQTYEYSSSSSGSSSPTKSPATSEFGQKYAYQVTTNKTFAESDGSPPPPVLPPRNYRPAPVAASASAATGTEHKFRTPPPTPGQQPQPQAPFQGDTDFNTPQPDHYANQLRQQMRKQFSQTGVGATRLQSYGLAEVKPSVAMSRPVDRPPIPQEAVAPPQPVPRSKTLPELSIGADGFGYPDGTKSAREPRETTITKMDITIGNAPQPQQPHHNHHSQQQHQHQPHHHHHQQQQQQQQQLLTQSHPQLQHKSQHQQQQHQQTQQHNHHPHNPTHRMQQSLSLTNIGSSSSSFRAPDAAPVAAARDRDSLSRLPVSERPLPVSDQNRNSPKERHFTEAPTVTETTTMVLPPSGVDADETLEKVPIPPSPPPQQPEDEDLRRRLSFEDEADVSAERYSNESYMTKRNNPRQGFNGNYRRSNSNEIPKPSTPPALSATSTPQLIIASGATSGSGAPSSPPAMTNPPRSETLVQVPSVMTVNKSLPSAENKTQMEAGPVLRTPTSGGTSGSSGHPYHPLSGYSNNSNTPPPVPPKYGRAAPVLPQPPPPLISPGSELAEEAMMSALESTPPELVLSSRPGVTNLDEASSLLSALRSGGAGSPSGASMVSSHSSSSSSSGLAGRTSKVTTPTTAATSGHTESSLTTSRERLNEAAITHNGHDVPSPDMSRRPTPRSRQSKKASLDSPPSLPSCPPPDHTYTYQPTTATKETDSQEDKEQDSSPTAPLEEPLGGAPVEEAEAEAGDASPGCSPLHVRQKSMEEIECEKVAAVVAIQIVDDDKQLSDVILPPPEHKMTTDYMSGLFDVADMPAVPTMVANRSPRSQQRDDNNKENRRSLETSPPPPGSVYWSPPSVASLQNKMREEGIQREEILREMSREIGVPDTSLQRQKEELEARIKQKLAILRNEKDALGEEISDNELLGKEVTGVVEKKVQNKGEFDKYKLYVDELDKVMYLLLKLSGRLARAENAVMSLPPDADEKDKMLLTMKRDEASEKHADAKLLKQGIDRRSQQVSGFLHRYLTLEEFDTYQYYIKMKSKLTMEQQEIDDKIKLGEEQLRALKRSMQR